MHAQSEKASWHPTTLDARIALSVLVCCLVSAALTALDLKVPVGEMRLDVIQKMTACISCLLCCQDGPDATRKAGAMRVLVTAVGGACGVAVVAIDLTLGSNPWILALLMAAGMVPTLCLCRLAGAPAFNARIGAISYLLVAATLSGPARLWYALFRVLSTVFGAVVVWGVTALTEPRSRS